MPISFKMKRSISTAYVPLIFLLLGSLCVLFCLNEPIKDFGNYYYGSKLFVDGNFTSEIYTSIHYFNKQIALYGEKNFFENYLPVPPFSALFYAPLCFLKSEGSKVVFNILSLIAFCLSLFRLLKFVEIRHWLLYFLPLVFIYPLYNNISQGQTYLLISAFLIEGFLSSEKGSVFYPSLLFAIAISLKLFPAFILIYFLIKKQFKLVFTTLGLTATLFVLTYLILPKDTTLYYFTNILPRLFNNDVVGTYYHGNQSVYTALLQLFSYDEFSNPNPIFNAPLLVVLFESLFYSIVLVLLFSLQKHNSFIGYSVILFSSILIGRYNTSYGMLLILPLSIALFKESDKTLFLSFLLMGVALTISLPVGSMANLPFVFKFARLFGVLLIFFLTVSFLQLRVDFKLFSFLFLPMFIFKYVSFSILPVSYFKIQNSQGILYAIKVHADSITLKSTLGEKDFEETYKLAGKIEKPIGLSIRNNVIYYDNKIVCDTKDNKLNPFIYNDSIVFMSDLNQAVGFYKLRKISIHQE